MKTKLMTLILALAACGATHADEEKGKRPGPPRGARPVPPAVLEKFDKDGDGKLSKEEREAMMEARKAEMLKKFDKDGDGELNEEERAEARKAMPRRGRGPEGQGPRGGNRPEGGERKRRGPRQGGQRKG
jgi:hypothetical protein